jgi:hypothetical protein
MSERTANILIGILATILMLGITMVVATSIKPVSTTTTVFTLTTIPRSTPYKTPPLFPIVQVKVTTSTTVIHTPVYTSPYPYQDLCAFAGTHDTSGQFIENYFVWIFNNKAFDSYDEHRQSVLDLMAGDPWCEEEHERTILEGSYPYMFEEGDT